MRDRDIREERDSEREKREIVREREKRNSEREKKEIVRERKER